MKLNKKLVLPETLAKIIEYALNTEKSVFKGAMTKNDYLKDCCYIIDGPLTIHVITEYEGKTCNYYTYKDGREIIEGVPEGSTCYCIMARHYWKPEHEIPSCGLSATPALGYNLKYNKTRNYAYSYDLKSAYAGVIVNGWIDTTTGPMEKIVEEDEVGFTADLSQLVEVGEYSMFVFKKCAPPPGLLKFIEVYYNRKEHPKDRKEKVTAKNMLCHPIGCLQNKNYFLRAYVVASCNTYILNLIDENTLHYNTDCIVSLTRRPDIEANIGPNVGQWKFEREGMFAYRGYTYQWDNEKPTWRSVAKSQIPEEYDVLNDNTELIEGNVWYMDWEKIKFTKKEGVIENENW